MDATRFGSLIREAETRRRLARPVDAEWFVGYARGLRRHHHGAKFGTPAEHEKWLASADPLGRGYRAGFAGAAACPHTTTRNLYDQRPPSEGRKLVAVRRLCEDCGDVLPRPG